MLKKLLVAAALICAAGSASVAIASAAPQEVHKVTICHGTNSVTNPYVKIDVDVDSADGNTSNDNGQGDHSEHTGPVATSEAVAQSLKDNKQAWGDIIPPHDNYAGLNWTAEGQAVYNNGCNYATPGRGGENPTPPTPATTSTPSTPVATNAAVLPNTGGSEEVTILSIAAIGLSGLLGASFVTTRLASRFVK